MGAAAAPSKGGRCIGAQLTAAWAAGDGQWGDSVGWCGWSLWGCRLPHHLFGPGDPSRLGACVPGTAGFNSQQLFLAAWGPGHIISVSITTIEKDETPPRGLQCRCNKTEYDQYAVQQACSARGTF